jgi:lipid-A-disaccharide synthase-like uncharacterized protein
MSSHLDALWLAIGFSGQALFSARFIVQWLVSEKRRASVVPTSFWYLSIAGGLTLLLYAIHTRATSCCCATPARRRMHTSLLAAHGRFDGTAPGSLAVR